MEPPSIAAPWQVWTALCPLRFVRSGVVVPAGDLATREFLQGGDIGAEAAANRLEEVVGELRLRRRRLLGIVDDLLDDPAHRLRQAVEVAVEGTGARQLDQLLHALVFVALRGARLLPLAVELLGLEAGVDASELEGAAHRLVAFGLQLLLRDHGDLLAVEVLE